MCAGLPALDAEEQAFVEELLAGRAGPGALVEIITARYGPYEPWHPIDDEGLRVVGRDTPGYRSRGGRCPLAALMLPRRAAV
ncbi:MAG: hypothetical protein M5U14_22225, partial [Acidimicrobiia bacterium]|nr:hypothetical protein [Acidimicrobiia bacterium]